MKANSAMVDSMNFLMRSLRKFSALGLLLFTTAGLGALHADTPVSLVFQNNTGVSDSQIFIQFLGGGSVTGTYVDSLTGTQTIQANTAYSLAQLQNSSLDLSQFSGRIYVNYGAYGLSNLGADNGGYTPSAANPLDPNYNTRYQYFEATITPQANGSSTFYGDLSYIDFTAMSMSMSAVIAGSTTLNPAVSNNNQFSQNTQVLVNAAASSAVTPTLPILPAGASSTLPNSSFARVISPQFSGDGVYHDFTAYLGYLATGSTTGSLTTGTSINPGAISVNIVGTYVGTGGQPSGSPSTQAQTYSFTGTFNQSGSIVLTASTLSGTSSVSWIPTQNQGAGVGNNVTITISEADLNSQNGIYGNNVPYTITLNGSTTIQTTGITNDVYGRVVGDLLAGLSFGYVGSTVQVTDVSGSTVALGSLPSSEWWASGEAQTGPTWIPTGITGGTITGTEVYWNQTPASQGIYFSTAQPGEPLFYNGYANNLEPVTDGYGFPLQDRLGTNLLSYNTIDQSNTQILLTINPDGTMALATGIWNGSAGDGQWGTAGNWLVNGSGSYGASFTTGVPLTGASVQFEGASPTGTYTIDTQMDRTVSGIDFNYGAGTFTINNNTITLAGAGANSTANIVNSSTNTQTINSNLQLASNSYVIAAFGDIVLGGSVTLSSGGTAYAMVFGGNQNTTVNGDIADGATTGGMLIKVGPGVLTLNGNNSFSGGLIHAGGTLVLGNDSAAGTGTLTLGSTLGALTVLQASGSARTLANDVSIGGDVTVNGSNGFTFNGNTTLTGTAGVVFTVTNSVPVNFAGAITESTTGLSLVKSGTGTMTFSGSSANTFSGPLAVNQGTLVLNKSANVNAYAGSLTIGTGQGSTPDAIVQVNADGQLPSAQSITINTDGQLNLQTYAAATANLIMSGGSVVGSGSLTLASGGGIQFTGVNDASATIASGLVLQGNQTFQVAKTSAANQLIVSGPVTGDGTATAINFTKTGSGVLELTGTNSLAGTVNITVAGGTLKTTSIANASVSLNGGALGATSSGSVVAPVQIQELYTNNGALLLGLGASGTSDQIAVSGSVNLNTGGGSTTTFFFQNDGFTTGSGDFTLVTGGGFNSVDLSSLDFASIGIHGLTGTFVLVGNDLNFVGQAGVTGTWSGTAGDGNWTTSNNWQEGSVPASGADLTFTGTGQAISTDSNQTTGAITFDSAAGTFTINDNTIVLGGDLTNDSANTQTINSNITLNADRIIASNSGSLVLTGSVALSKTAALASTLTVSGTSNTTITGVISDGPAAGGSILKTGTGTLVLAGTNTFSGEVTIAGGTVVAGATYTGADSLGNQSALGTNSLVFDGGALQLTSSGSFSQFRDLQLFSTGTIDTNGNSLLVMGVISGAGGLVKNGAGDLELNFTGTLTNSYQGATTVNGGSLLIDYGGALGNSTAGVTVASGASLVINGAFDVNATPLTLNGTGDGGNGALQLTGGDSNWTGDITLGSNASIWAGSSTTLGLTGTVNVGGNNLTLTGTSSTINLSGNLTGTGSLTVSGTVLVVNLTGANSGFSGGFNVQQGTMNVSQASALGNGSSSLTVASGGEVDFTNTTDMSVSLGTITLSGTGANADSGALNNVGGASTTISGDILLDGDTQIKSTTGQLTLTGSINAGSNSLTLDNLSAQMILSGVVSGSGTINVTGNSSVLLSGANTFTGDIQVAGGNAVAVGSAQGLGSGTTYLASGGAVYFQGGFSGTTNGSISGFGTGIGNTGMLNNISGTNTYSGNVTFTSAAAIQATAGELTLSGTLTGSGAPLTIQGSGVVNLTGGFSNIPVVTIASGTLASGNLPGATLNVGSGAPPTSGTTPTFSPGDVNNIQTVSVENLSLNPGGQLLMDLSNSTSDQIQTTNAFAISNPLVFQFNNDGYTTPGGTYVLLQTANGAIALTSGISFTSNIAGLSGTFSLADSNQELVFQSYVSTPQWTSSNANGVWSDSSSWSTGGAPGEGSAVAFSSSGTSTTVDTETDHSVGGIEFLSGSGSMTIANNTINTYGQIVNNSTSTQTISSGINLVSNTTVNAASGTVNLTGTVNFGSYSSTPMLTVTGSGTTMISGGISSGAGISGTLVKSGTGALQLSGTNTFTGETHINGGNLILDGTTSAGNSLTIGSGGTLSGIGTAYGHVTVASGGTLSPGHSPGTLTTGSQTWSTGGNYNWQILDATGAAGTGYDTMVINGTLDLSGIDAGGFSLNLWSLSAIAPDVDGLALNFDSSTNYSWVLASTTGGISGFSSSDFTIYTTANNGTAGFANPYGGTFSVVVIGNNLVLDYQGAAVPEPSTWALMAVSLVGLILLVRRNRAKNSA